MTASLWMPSLAKSTNIHPYYMTYKPAAGKLLLSWFSQLEHEPQLTYQP
jgi:hypothetical protein